MLRTYVVVSIPIFRAVMISTLLNHWLGSSPAFSAAVRQLFAGAASSRFAFSRAARWSNSSR